MTNISTCHCINVEMGSYDNQVSMKTPFDLGHRKDRWVCIDTCIATEIGWLWHQGVKTANSCCGHQKVPACVINEDEGSNDIMLSLGYKSFIVPSGYTAFYLRNGTQGEFPYHGQDKLNEYQS